MIHIAPIERHVELKSMWSRFISTQPHNLPRNTFLFPDVASQYPGDFSRYDCPTTSYLHLSNLKHQEANVVLESRIGLAIATSQPPTSDYNLAIMR